MAQYIPNQNYHPSGRPDGDGNRPHGNNDGDRPSYYGWPRYDTPVVTTVSTGCCDTTLLYMIIAGLLGGMIGYGVMHTHKK